MFQRPDSTCFASTAATTVELIDRCYRDVTVKLSPARLQIGEDRFRPDQVHYLEAVTCALTLPREAMGFGDVKFVGAIGTFTGWEGTVFAVFGGAMIGTIWIGLALLWRKYCRLCPT